MEWKKSDILIILNVRLFKIRMNTDVSEADWGDCSLVN